MRIGIYVDGIHTPVQAYEPYIDQWVTTDTFEKFAQYISDYLDKYDSLPELISFGGCMSLEHKAYMETKSPSAPIRYSTFITPTGLHYAKWLTSYCTEKGIKLDCRIAVHEIFPQMASDIVYWLTEYQKTEGITPTVFEFQFSNKKNNLSLTDSQSTIKTANKATTVYEHVFESRPKVNTSKHKLYLLLSFPILWVVLTLIISTVLGPITGAFMFMDDRFRPILMFISFVISAGFVITQWNADKKRR